MRYVRNKTRLSSDSCYLSTQINILQSIPNSQLHISRKTASLADLEQINNNAEIM